MYIMQEVFGMPASRLIVPPNEKYGKFVLNEVLEAGNFGKHDERNRFGRSKLGHNLQRVYRDIRLVRYFPAEAMSEPFFRVWHFFWRVNIRNNYFYHLEADSGISILDESLGIDCRIPRKHANLSEKDTKHEVLKDFESPFEY